MTNSFFVECLIGDDDWIPTTFDDLLFENPPLQQDDVNEGAGGPAINDWEEAPCAIPTITIDKARREAWNQGKRECAAIREKLKRRLNALGDAGNKKLESEFLFDSIFGPQNSRFGQLFC